MSVQGESAKNVHVVTPAFCSCNVVSVHGKALYMNVARKSANNWNADKEYGNFSSPNQRDSVWPAYCVDKLRSSRALDINP